MGILRTYLDLFRRNPSLRRLLVGEFISGIGDWLYLVAILVVVYAETGSAVLLGVLGAARILPYIVLSVPAGIVVDRYDRRLVLLITDVARGVLMLMLAGVVLIDAPVVAIVVLSVIATCFSTFFGPAISALLPTLVDESDLGPANSAWATLDNVAYIIGPALAGILIATGGLSVAFLLNAVSFGIVAVVMWRLRDERARGAAPNQLSQAETPPPASTPWRTVLRPLAGPFVLDSVTSFVGGGLSVMTVLLAVDVLHAGEAGTGYLNAATGVGGVLAGLAAGSLLARRLGVPLLLGGGVAAVGLGWLALAGDLTTAMIAIGLAVAGSLLLDVVNTTLVQRGVADQLRGRAMGLLQTSSAIFYSAGSLVLPLAAASLGATWVLAVAAGLTVAGVAVALLLSRATAPATALDPERAMLVSLPIFAGLPAPRLEAAARSLQPVTAGPGEVVVREGDPADRFYLISEGHFEVSQSEPGTEQPRRLRQLGAGDVFGEIGLLRRSARTASVTALTSGRLLSLDDAEFTALVSAGPGLSSRLLDLYRGALAR
jgi:predicted MFS family arabinose efflux permease